MKIKKLLKYSLAVALVFGSVGTIAGCGKDNTKNENDQYQIYMLAVDSGYNGTYEEWLATIKGERGEKGETGHTPVITIGGDGFWYVDGVSTNVKATGNTGETGKDGATWHTGTAIPSSDLGKVGDLYFNTLTQSIYVKTANGWGSPVTTISDGKNGSSPTIEIVDGYWWLNDQNTGVKATGSDGVDGHSPVVSIGFNGNWFIDDVDSGVKAVAKDGKDGDQVEFQITETHIQWKYKTSNVWNNLLNLDVIKGENGSDGKNGVSWLSGEGSPANNISDVQVGDFYFDTLNGAIYEYVKKDMIYSWEFKVDLNAQKKLVLEDGIYTGRLEGYDFEVEMLDQEIVTFNIFDYPVGDYAVSYEIDDQVISFNLIITDGENDELKTFSYVLNGNRLIPYCEENELELLKGSYFDFYGDSYTALTLSDKEFTLFYQNRAFKGIWEIENINDNEGHKTYELLLRDENNLVVTIEVSYYSRSVFVTNFDCDFTKMTYSDGESTYVLSHDEVIDEYYLTIDDEDAIGVDVTYFKNEDNIICAENDDSMYVFNYISGEVTTAEKVVAPFVGNIVYVGETNSTMYRYRRGILELIENGCIREIYNDYSTTINFVTGEVSVVSLDNEEYSFTANLDNFTYTEGNKPVLYYNDGYEYEMTVTLNSDLTTYNIEVKRYADCYNEEQLKNAIEREVKYINVKSNFTVENTITINKGTFVIDLGGNVISSGSEYISNSLLRIQDDYDSMISVNIKNGYIGNFNENKELVKTDTNRGYQLSKIGLSVHGGPRVEVTLDGVYAAGYETGFSTQGLETYAGGTIVIRNSYFYSTMTDPKDGAGAYLPGYATYIMENSTFVGATGIYAKSGEITLINCTVTGTGDMVDPIYNGNGYWPTGSALVVDSTYGYKKPMNISILGGTYTSTNNYGVQEIVTKPANIETMQKYSTIYINDDAIVTGGAGSTSYIVEE